MHPGTPRLPDDVNAAKIAPDCCSLSTEILSSAHPLNLMTSRRNVWMSEDGADFYRKREKQELEASDKATDPMIKRLHWEMAHRYAYLAKEAENESGAEIDTADLPDGTVSL
jgi:hypothetical protein